MAKKTTSLKELLDFSKREHKRLVEHYSLHNNPKTKYTIFAKLIEEVGELSEAILIRDSLQRGDKLRAISTEKNSEKEKNLDSELADIILCTLILARELNVDIEKSLKEKMNKINKRKYK